MEYPRFHARTYPVAQKRHICTECRSHIYPGEPYEKVTGYWDSFDTFKTCKHCVDTRDMVREHCPELEWCYTSLWEDMSVELEEGPLAYGKVHHKFNQARDIMEKRSMAHFRERQEENGHDDKIKKARHG